MITKLQEIVTKVEEVPELQYTTWTSSDEVAKYPAFVLDEPRETYQRNIHNGNIYNYTLSVDFYVLALSNTSESDFEALRESVVKKIFEVSGYSRIDITEGRISHVQIGAHKILAYHGTIEFKKVVYSYE
jgi:hypothetical protein